jgi:peroxiredoxin family protein
MKMPFGPKWFKGISWNIPNAVQSLVPGYENLATSLMKQTIRNTGVASIPELRELCQEADVKMIACQMTVELFGFEQSDFIDNIEYGGAATFFEFAGETDICLFI